MGSRYFALCWPVGGRGENDPFCTSPPGLTRAIYLHKFGDMEKLDAIAALGALAHDTRLAIFRLLVEAEPMDCLPVSSLTASVCPRRLSFHVQHAPQPALFTFSGV